MMVSPTMNKLFDKVDSRYTLVVAVAKRARQLVDGQQSLIETNSVKPVTIAMEEIAAGKLRCLNGKHVKKTGEKNVKE